MKSKAGVRLATVLALALLLLSIAGPALAQTQDNEVRQVTFGNLIAALNNINVEINNLQALNDLTITDVRLVNVEDVLNDNNVPDVQ